MIPNKLIVGLLTYSIEFVDFVDAEDSCGECVDSSLRIKIKRDMPIEAIYDTLIHESLHACNMEWSESEVLHTTRALMCLCRDNPWLKDILFT